MSQLEIDQTNRSSRFFSDIFGYGTLFFTLGMLGFFLILPVGMIMVKAFVGPEGFTFEYFQLLFHNQLQITSIYNSLLIGVAVTVLSTALSLPLAIVNARFEFPFKNFLSGLLLVPMVMPPFVGAIGIQRFFARRGSVNLTLMEWGVIDTPIDWLGPETMFWAVVVLLVLHLYPIMYLNLTAALANVDPSMEEMASTLGISRLKQFRDIVWPLARPGFFAGAIIVFIWAVTDLGTPLLVGFHKTMPVKIFNMVTDANENPVGYALVCIVVVMTIFFFVMSKLAVKTDKYSVLSKGHVTSPVRPLPKWAFIPVYLLFIGVVLAALVPHGSIIVTSLSHKWFMTPLPETYTTEHFSQIFNTDLPSIGVKNSFFFASLATIVDLFLGLFIAYVVVRKVIPFASVLDSLAMIPLALPGIVLAFGYVVTYSNTFLDPMVNPTVLLVIAYAIRRLPFMVRSAAAGLQQTSVALEEASETFGATKFHTLRKITLPLVTANLIAGSLLTFAYAMLDVSDSLILAMKDSYYPMTKAIYALFLEQGSGEFTASALGVVGMLILTICILGASTILGKKMGELFRS